jgi:signal transduction histidine kinase
MYKIIILIGFLFTINISFSQKHGQALIDSLEQELPKMSADTSKAKAMYKIAATYYSINLDKCLLHANQGLKFSEKINYKRGIANFLMLVGLANSDNGKDSIGLIYLKKSLQAYTDLLGKEDVRFNLISNNVNIGRVYRHTSDFTKAQKYYFDALSIALKLNDPTQTSLCYNNISALYFDQKNYTQALKYGQLCLKLGIESNTIKTQLDAYNILSGIYIKTNDTANAIQTLNQGLVLSKKNDAKKQEAIFLSNLGVLYEDNPTKALTYKLDAKQIWDSVSPNYILAVSNFASIGKSYLDIIKLKDTQLNKSEIITKATYYLENAKQQCIAIQLQDLLLQINQNLSELYAIKGDYKNAYLHFKDFYTINDSLFSQENKNKIAEIDGNYQLSLKDKEIQLNQVTIASQKKQQLFFIIGLILISAIGLLLFRQNKIRKQTNTTLLHLNNELDEANKIKAKFFAIISHDLRSPIANLVSFLNLKRENPELLSAENALKHQQNITQTAEDLLETMESMLLWSKGQMETFKPTKKQIDVDDLFLYIKKYFANINDIQFNCSNPQKLSIFTDENYLKTIMHNLTANAIKILKDKPNAMIDWSCYQKDNQIILSIKDNGAGVNKEKIKALFEESNTVNTKTGLGLHIIRDLAKAIGCEIKMDTQNNVGTTFTLAI